ncbi:hypothetical protein ACMGDK_11400 [Chryseobacterium sp. DT-3]|uniref:hypothetical protein n=1 Tax=Chryseobacterium sp. DT-3 TaxID=3396164 RepID=UPI003F1D06CF
MPAAIAIIPAVLAAGVGVAQMTSANKQAKKLQNQINEYDRQDLTNPYESLQVSTLGADRTREDMARNFATAANTVAQGGSRAVNSFIPNIIAQQNDAQAKIMADLDQQEKERQRLVAQGNSMVTQMQENRENNDLLGLGNALNVANQNRVNGVNQLSQSLLSIASGASAGLFNMGTGQSNNLSSGGQLNPINLNSAPIITNTQPINATALNIPNNINLTNNTQRSYNPFFDSGLAHPGIPGALNFNPFKNPYL